ncbi:sigma-54-dependent Fis family transcriptional regulator [Phyllobacterium sp. 21LDTY02-6]|uniref:sigma-54-dependent Fis family transcriptional regulator n=1 Tax=unclassified Phyllobacterium TaxID=2638441 RepID=UPI002020BB33|nr:MULTISPECIES: sigma-54-dependent Fis family transcriptional regulator [unclassified Phyllobacterium]MCO4319112.1 sigma-54-dependent Fis family transcriptional regulator [Phyllobacterium sp. 21LDTY02-6]MCX8279002.1 sigma-54-dependent Fis family transcriptional regulator [Phyllobacterium sp. 0TCS1.6C]MCX8293786.1 sigma-54-dependent Fis family transcriptional regulator [Phyllobacterium sp. 0TCS1.6A]
MVPHSEHIREIESVGLGAATGRDDNVVQSWLRCINEHRLDPAQSCEAYIVPDTELREHRQQSEELISIARSGLENLFRQVAGQNYVLLLSDRQGVTVDFLGDPLFDNNLRKAGLYLGSQWAESRAGTCAVGACIETGEALSIHQTDHFDNTHTPLSCTAAPIYNVRGRLSAVLDISLLSSPIKKASQNLALHLVTATVRRIEMANLMAQARQEWVLRFARSPEFLDVDPEAAISIDGSGRIIGMTNGGAKILARSVSLDWRRPDDLIGQPISRFFDMEIDDLPDLMRQRRPQDRLVFARDGNALFAHAIEPNATARAPASVRESIPRSLRSLGGGDPRLAMLQAKAAKLATTPLSILIQGETGTGKEYLARAIHDSSGVKGRFVAINCAAIPEQLIEGELFGHVPGAFTGANPKGRKGLIEEADGGTLFLDEIGDMPIHLQSRLLRVLAERELLPIGAMRPKPVNIRVVAASHRLLGTLVKDGLFREDLFYRLNVATLTLPSLRERSDFEWLLDAILQKYSVGENVLTVAPDALDVLKAYAWPGNIRELDNVVSVGAALCQTGIITLADLPEAMLSVADQKRPAAPGLQKSALEAMLIACDWNVSEAARRLGVDRSTVHRQIKRHVLSPRVH